jgi:hypothetical protein
MSMHSLKNLTGSTPLKGHSHGPAFVPVRRLYS